MLRPLLFLALSALFACQTSKPANQAALLIELRTGGCFGYCPVIRLTVRQSGQVEYEGQQFAERQGLDTFRLTKDELKRLRKQVRQVNLWQYPDRIESEVVDAPWATLTTARDGNTKSVIGSMDRPESLLELENALKNLAEAHGFQVKRGVNPREMGN